MEVGEQAIDHLQFVARVDEEVGVTGGGAGGRGCFERAQRRGADREHPPAGKRLQRLVGNAVTLAMHAVSLYGLCAQRLESAETDVQRQAGDARAALLQSL